MERVDADLVPFAQNNPSGYRFAFGTDTATDDINVNYNDNIKKGWGTTPNEFPEVEDFNAFAYTSGYLTAYLYQMGIAEWNNKQKYKKYSRVIGSDGKIYKAKKGTDLAPNVDKNPTTDTTNWEIDNQFDINSLVAKITPVDSDNLVFQETGGLFKKLSWANIKATLKTSFDTLYLALTGDQTVSGVKTFSSNIVGNITGNATNATNVSGGYGMFSGLITTKVNNASFAQANDTTLSVKGDGTYPASMSFNRTGAFAVNFGVDTDNKLKVGGWSMGSVYEIYHQGNPQPSTTYASAFTTVVGSAPSYACRAWVNFNGQEKVAIRASGNVSSITDNGVGDYTVNLAVPLVDEKSSASVSTSGSAIGDLNATQTGCKVLSSSSIRIEAGTDITNLADPDNVYLLVFR